MHAELEDWKNGWFGLNLSAKPDEIKQLIGLLQALLNDHDQHFHISSNYKAESGLGDIEISVMHEPQQDNLLLSSLALGPGEEIP